MDNHKNLAYSLVAVAPAPGNTGLTLEVLAGQGSRFPPPPFNVTVWASGELAQPTNAEILRVVSLVGDTMTVLRAQEGTTARYVKAGDQIANTITVKVITDIEALAGGGGGGGGGGGSGTILGTIAAQQIAFGTAANTIGGNSGFLFDSSVQHVFLGNLGGIDLYNPGTGDTSVPLTLNVQIATGDLTGPIMANYTLAFTPLSSNTGKDVYAYNSEVHDYGTQNTGSTFAGNIWAQHTSSGVSEGLWALYLTTENSATGGAITGGMFGYAVALSNQGGAADGWAFTTDYVAGTFGNFYTFYSVPLGGIATNAYSFWSDEQGVFRIKADNTFDALYQAITALYNPQFTKYTAGAANYERIVQYWSGNVATYGAEKGGTGTLRALRLIGASADFQDGSGAYINVTAAHLTATGPTQTTSAPAVSATQTWNAAGVTFTGLSLNITNTASAVGSLLADWQLDSTSRFSLGLGSWTATSGTNVAATLAPSFAPTSTSTMVGRGLLISPTVNYSAGTPGAGSYEALRIAVTETALPTGTSYLVRASSGAAGTTDVFSVTRAGVISFSSNSHLLQSDGSSSVSIRPGGTLSFLVSASASEAARVIGGLTLGNVFSNDATFWRDAANVVGLRNTTSAQIFNVYNTQSSSTNFERLMLDWATTANVAMLYTQKGSGGGTARVLQVNYGGTTTSAISVPITSGNITFGGGITLPGGATFLTTNTALTDGAGVSAGTITTAPAAGNPTKWIGIDDNGTTRYIPAW